MEVESGENEEEGKSGEGDYAGRDLRIRES